MQAENDFGPFKAKLTAGYLRIRHNDSNSDLDGLGAFTGPQFTNASLFNGFPSALLQNLGFPVGTLNFLAGAAVPRVTQNLFDTNKRRHKQFSTELELRATPTTSTWAAVALTSGKGQRAQPAEQRLGLTPMQPCSATPPSSACCAGSASADLAAQYAPLLAPSFRATNPAQLRLVQTLATLNYSATSESTALYGQFTVLSGRRRQRPADHRRRPLHLGQQGDVPHPERRVVALATPETGEASFSKFTWNVMLGYDLADGIATYARAATGYRSGGFNAQDNALAGTTRSPSSPRMSFPSKPA